MSPRPPTWARRVLRGCALLVPGHRRREWLEEWEAELEALVRIRAGGPSRNYPGLAGFVVGALPHALWMRREAWSMDGVWQDVTYAARVLRRGWGFTVVATLTLALGIGANAAIFSLVNGLLFRAPAGIADPDRLVQIARSYDSAPRWDNWSWPASEFIRDEGDRVLSGVAGYSGASFVLGRGESVEPVFGQYVSGGYFPLLGVRPALGRLFDSRDEVAPGAHPVVVLSNRLWQRRFGGDPKVVGSTITLGDAPYEIVGVAPEAFVGSDILGAVPELWVPAMQRTLSSGGTPFAEWGSSWFYLVGRLEEGVGLEAAREEMDRISLALREMWEPHDDIRILLAQGIGLAPEERAQGQRLSLLLGGIALLVLLLTCANVGNLFLTRASARTGEVGLRQALGAARGRVVRQLVTESLVLSLVATAVAVPLVVGVSRLLPSIFPLPLVASLAPDVRVYLFLAAVGVLAGLLFGAIPAWITSRSDVAATLRETGPRTSRGRTRLRDALVVGQLAISLGLVSAAALLGRSVLNARAADPGFDPDGLVVAFVNLRAAGTYTPEATVDFQTRLLAELAALPGVTRAALAGQAPVLGGHSRRSVAPADRPEDPALSFEAEYTPVTPDYFETLGIPLLQGRTFRSPGEETEPVVVVNRALAELYWPGREAVGQEILAGGEEPARVIGVVGDVQMRSLRAAANPGVYYPYHQEPGGYLALHLTTTAGAAAMAPGLRAAVARVDPRIPVTGITDLRDGLADSLADARTFGVLVTVFAGLALLIALIGLYGLIAQGVAQRTRELGIRMALGAAAGTLVRMVLARGLVLSALGLALGLGVSLALGRALQDILFEVGSAEPGILGGAALLLLAASMLATWIPARRASRVDAAVSLRE